jgi:hypothetical protein
MDIASLIHGGPLPDRLDVPPHLHRQFDRLWRRSVASQTEWGLTLTVDRAGRLHGRHAHSGATGGFVANLRVGWDERLLGVYHTHVYASGDTGFAFGGNDFAGFVAHPKMLLLLVQSGDDLFALVRTPHTAGAVPADFLGGNGRFYERLADCWEANPHWTYQEALRQTNVDFCQTFGIAFYQGLAGQPLEVVLRL